MIDYSVSLVLAAAQGLMAAGLLCFYSPAAGLTAIALVLLLLAAAALVGRLQFQAIYEGERMDVVVLTFVYDLIRLVPVLQAQRTERQAFVQWAQNFLAFQSRIVRSTRIGNVLSALEAGWEVLTLALCFVAVAYVGVGAAFATGAAIAFVVALGKLNAAGLKASHALIGLAKLMPMAKLARSLIEQTVAPQAGGAPLSEIKGRVTLNNVSFSYDTRPILNGVSVDIAPGDFVGISGPSGGGKSTLLRLLLGLDTPRAGAVLIDGLDLRALDQTSVSRRIGVVMQNGQLWAGTIFDNIRGASTISLEEAEALSVRVGLAAELAHMPMGLQTVIGEGGLGLSSGEVQRILIARALAMSPSILILDEPAGALRGAAQQAILDMLAGLDITRIVVSHDVDLLAGATRLFVLDRGALNEVTTSATPFENESP
ncbi:MAG: ATP-binding cassette domain-containing protein [Proteobacteria bacterium]|nr:ATP-binding cassette domain-containing protein [Pseudomonadota bacterium]